MFLVVGAFSYEWGSGNDETYAILIMIGLVCGFVGDYLLGLRRINTQKSHEYLIYGMAMFLLGHIAYTIAFGKNSVMPFYYGCAIALAFALLLLFILKHTGLDFGKAKWPCHGYLLISSLVLVYAIGNAVMIPSNRTMAAGIGTALFVLSDLLLCFCYFYKKGHWKIVKWMNIICYYAGQSLIALSLYFAA
jgi:uncharacterized membrane protein YhhN